MQFANALHRLKKLSFLATLGFVEDFQSGAFQCKGRIFQVSAQLLVGFG